MSKTNCPNCGAELQLQGPAKGMVFFHCKPCGIHGKGKTATAAGKDLDKAAEKVIHNSVITTTPQSPKEVATWAQNNFNAIMQQSAQFIDKPETKRMIDKNVKYLMSADFKSAWETAEGQQSITEAFFDALYMGATLPDMGSIVPFGKMVEFIPAISAFEFALTSGSNPPFKSVNIECVYENDQYEAWRENGNFHFSLKMSMPRGEVIAVVVQAYDIERGAVIGEIYDATRLMEKAKHHSRSYQYYLADLQALRNAQAEGKDYIEKWNKKFYEKDITNPYAGADQPEMLRKVAGKTFFRPYMKIRNARAMETEWKEQGSAEGAGDVLVETLDASLASVKDAEFEEVNEGVNEGGNEKVNDDKKSKPFGEEI